jgi:hypothetical protein
MDKDTVIIVTWCLTAVGIIVATANVIVSIYRKPIDNYWEERLKRKKEALPPKAPRTKRAVHILLSYIVPILVIANILASQPLTKSTLVQILVMMFILFSNSILAVIQRNRELTEDWILKHMDRHLEDAELLSQFIKTALKGTEQKVETDGYTVEALRKLTEITSEMRKKLEEKNKQDNT